MIIEYTTRDNVVINEGEEFHEIPFSRIKNVELIDFIEIEEDEIENFLDVNNYHLVVKHYNDVGLVNNLQNRVRRHALDKGKEDKTKELIASLKSTLEVNGIEYSIKRIDIQKYKEAIDITKDYIGDDVVRLNSLSGEVTLSITDAENLIKTLSTKALEEYWRYNDKTKEIDACKTVTEILNTIIEE
jgi:hypothetical protein